MLLLEGTHWLGIAASGQCEGPQYTSKHMQMRTADKGNDVVHPTIFDNSSPQPASLLTKRIVIAEWSLRDCSSVYTDDNMLFFLYCCNVKACLGLTRAATTMCPHLLS